MFIELKCNSCSAPVKKRTKEVNRQLRKNPDAKFYCSLSCSGKQNGRHLIGRYPFIAGSVHHKKAIEAAKNKNTKHIGLLKHLNEIIRRAKRRDPSHNLTMDYLIDLWKEHNQRCALSNIPIMFDAPDFVQMASLDRIDSSVGYIVGNVQFVSCSINWAKSTMSDDRVRDLIKLIRESGDVE